MLPAVFAISCVLAAYGGSTPAPNPSPESTVQSPADCSHLTTEEQAFSQQLSPTSKQLFCHTFNTSQRHAAMEMTKQPDNSGQMPTPDMAVRQVARDNQMMIPMTMPSGSDGMSGGCPAQ